MLYNKIPTIKPVKKRKELHGLCGTKLYWIWSSMVGRTTNKKNKRYPLYGARGIGVCDEWRYSVSAFASWCFDNGYEDGGALELDRRDNDRGYSPDNCRFVEKWMNKQNRRVYNSSGLPLGVALRPKGRFQARIGFDKKRVSLGFFDTAEEAGLVYARAFDILQSGGSLNVV